MSELAKKERCFSDQESKPATSTASILAASVNNKFVIMYWRTRQFIFSQPAKHSLSALLTNMLTFEVADLEMGSGNIGKSRIRLMLRRFRSYERSGATA